MLDYWRVTRTPYARTAYEWLKAAGVTATRMHEYRADLAGPATVAGDPGETPAGVRVETVPASTLQPGAIAFDTAVPVALAADEWVVVATADGDPVGRAVLTDEPRPYVDPLERAVPITGSYIRRVFVSTGWRKQGVAAALVRHALEAAVSTLGADAATALVAADNAPSRRLFRSCGFTTVATHQYVRIGPFSRYRRGSRAAPTTTASPDE